MPRVERGELFNVGVIVYCPARKYLKLAFAIDSPRLSALADDLSLVELNDHLVAADKICKGGMDGGPIGQLSLGERFRWLTAPRSTVVQMSPVHSGLTGNVDETIGKLVEKLVK